MVSTWRFWSGKEINFSRSHPFQILLLLAIMLFRDHPLLAGGAVRGGSASTCFPASGRGRHIPGRGGGAGGPHWLPNRPTPDPMPCAIPNLLNPKEACVQDRHCGSLHPSGQGVEGRHLRVAARRGHLHASGRRPGLGQLDQVGDEITFVQPIDPDSFEHMDFTFFCGSEGLTRRHWRKALQAGSTVLDLSGALDQEPGVLVRAPWLGLDAAPDLFTPAVVPAHPAAMALGLLLERLQEAAPLRSAAATLLVPASEFGRGSHGRTAPADREPAQLPGHSAGDLRCAGGLQPALRVWRKRNHDLRGWRRGFGATMSLLAPGAGRRWPCRRLPRPYFTATHFRLRSNWNGRWTLPSDRRRAQRRSRRPGPRRHGFAVEPCRHGPE